MSEERRGDWMQTYSGRRFWPLDPRPDEVHIEDIAHALSNLCRFAGHVPNFYSVAEHSVHVSSICKPAEALWGLLHDASEAYLVDVPRPVKRYLQNYAEIERGVMAVVCQRFGLEALEPQSVLYRDEIMLSTEMRQLMKMPLRATDLTSPPCDLILPCWAPKDAEAQFLKRFADLTSPPV